MYSKYPLDVFIMSQHDYDVTTAKSEAMACLDINNENKEETRSEDQNYLGPESEICEDGD